MEFVDTTSASSLRYDSADQFGALFHIVIVRQRFMITPDGLVAAAVQHAVRDTDAGFPDGPAGLVYQEADLCPYKPRCDVIVNAIAHAPGGRAVPRVRVRLQVGAAPPHAAPAAPSAAPLIDKSLVVTGERRLERRSAIARAATSLVRAATLGLVTVPDWIVTAPAPFVASPVRYDYAYGGENRVAATAERRDAQLRRLGADNCLTPEQASLHPDAGVDGAKVPLAHSVCETNPLGRGYATAWYLRGGGCVSLAAPRTEHPDRPFGGREFLAAARDPTRLRPAGFGVIGRAWQPRRSLLGVVDEKEHWEDDEFPALPAEFDHGYWNHAPQDQQCAHLRGDEMITLTNLSPAGAPRLVTAAEGAVQRFQLPGLAYYLALGDARGRAAIKPCALDTVYIDPEASTVDLVWRGTVSADAGAEKIHLCAADSVASRDRLEQLLQRQESVAAAPIVEA